MRVLCVGRHTFLSEHLCRYFSDAEAECLPVVGIAEAIAGAARFEPHVIVCDSELLSDSVLDAWSRTDVVRDVPLLSVSMTRPPDDVAPGLPHGPSGVVFLAGVDRERAMRLLTNARQSRAVTAPDGPVYATSVTVPAR